jgi:hypothetical protein
MLATLGPPPPGLLTAHRVSTAVNDVRSDGPGLREPIDELIEAAQGGPAADAAVTSGTDGADQ